MPMNRKPWPILVGIVLVLALAAAALWWRARPAAPTATLAPALTPSPTPSPVYRLPSREDSRPVYPDLPTVTPPAPGEPTVPPEALAMRAAPTATPGDPPPPPPTPTPTSYPTPKPTPTPVIPTSYDDVPMIEIPAGEFIMGSTFDDVERRGMIYANEKRSWIALSTRFNDEIPQMTVYLDNFEIDQVEVTNARYRHCVEAGICQPASDRWIDLPDGYITDPRYNNYPAIGVSWFDAYSYCQWIGKRLPTEAEWEKAARGTDGRRYSWGDEWKPTYGAFNGKLYPTGSFPRDTSPYGVLDMAGNASEWVLNWYQGYPGTQYQALTYGQRHRTVRGQALDDLVQITSRSIGSPNHAAHGFRCVRGKAPLELEQAVVAPIGVTEHLSTTTPWDLSDMVYVPAGEFIMGTDEVYELEYAKDHLNERPAHVVYLDAFYIDRYPVTHAQYVAFLNALGEHRWSCEGHTCAGIYIEEDRYNTGHYRILREGREYVVREGYEDFPATGISWYGAQAYCQWLGRRLPTEAEWEKAARGTDGRRYPWGNEWDEGSQADTRPHEYPVGGEAINRSPYNVMDVLGKHKGEWTGDWYSTNYYAYSPIRNPTGPQSGEFRVVRSGSGLPAIWGLTSRRFGTPEQPFFSFRCAYSYGADPMP